MNTPEYKFPTTFHLPWTQSSTSDDKILTNQELIEYFIPMEDCYASLKMDGENTTIGRGYSHARSLDSKDHWSRHHIKQLAALLYRDIPDGWRICGENMLALHSIPYHDLESFFYVFAIWDETNTRLSLDDMQEFCECLDLSMVPVLKRGSFKDLNLMHLALSIVPVKHLGFGLDPEKDEGYVISNAQSFHYNDMKKNAAKCVRANHVKTEDGHWFFKTDKNTLREG